MQRNSPSFFQGLTENEISSVLKRLEHREFPAGSTVLAEGDSPREIYIIESGTADIFVADRKGHQHRVNQVRAGDTVGEMSIFTGQPASATVQAITDLDVLVLREDEFRRTAAAFPRIYNNLGAILSERLARSNRRVVRREVGEVIVLQDFGAPPLLGYALACNIAWHTRTATALLYLTQGAPPPPLQTIAAGENALIPGEWSVAGRSRLETCAHLMVLDTAGPDGADMLASLVDELCHTHDFVLVQAQGDADFGLEANHILRLGTPDTRLPAMPGNLPLHTLVAMPDGRSTGRPDRTGVLRVPALSTLDKEALQRGVMPAKSAAGKALGWAARYIAGLMVGVALGAGAMKGYAHLGVLQVLDRLDVPIDYLAGTSIGAIVAALYAMGYDPSASADLIDKVGSATFRLTVPTASLLSNGGIRAGLRAVGGNMRFEDVDLPLAMVAADIITGQEVIFRRGLLWQAVLASMAIPGVYPAQCIAGHQLVDGGVLNPVPSNVVADMGANVVIAVKLATRWTPPPADTEAIEAFGRPPTVLQVITRSIDLLQSKIAADSGAAATILIEPDFENAGGFGLRSFTQGRRFIPLGTAAAEAAVPRIAAALPWVQL